MENNKEKKLQEQEEETKEKNSKMEKPKRKETKGEGIDQRRKGRREGSNKWKIMKECRQGRNEDED